MKPCCEETKYNLILKFDSWQKLDSSFQEKVKIALKEALGLSERKSATIVEFASVQGSCRIRQGSTNEMTRLSLKLAQKSIPHEVKLAKK